MSFVMNRITNKSDVEPFGDVKVTRFSVKFAGILGLILQVFYAIMGFMYLADYNQFKMRDTMTEKDVIDFHSVFSSTKERNQYFTGTFCGFLTIPFALYHCELIKRLLNAFFDHTYPWASFLFVHTNIISILLFCILLPIMALTIVLFSWEFVDNNGNPIQAD
mmetsp:Transcript_43750/g.53680  ORF Transcript_43750/g.53680 Transcript_43750/m.53680 type:complete len:163 (-) Transcript_43750:140-628(-)